MPRGSPLARSLLVTAMRQLQATVNAFASVQQYGTTLPSPPLRYAVACGDGFLAGDLYLARAELEFRLAAGLGGGPKTCVRMTRAAQKGAFTNSLGSILRVTASN